MTDDLVTFIRARLDEDDQVARATTGGGMPWHAQARSELRTAPAGSVGRNNDPDWSIHWVQIAIEGSGPSDGDRRAFDSRPDFRHIARHDPARVLRGVEAKRRTVERHWHADDDIAYTHCRYCRDEFWPCPDIRDLASEWSTHPDYRREWKP